ncbi:uncharacterized protein C3orf38 homolog [Macrosteles quadrilineatus]|uniref:uncharacterized protein C3orf38 homolog n=1 Tax=Macrosteles quadrilineatus TaxID=74068 RepID=UPI0023E13E39|nr:uncharacterized protein C3orf38 homolog [Macrosteles quadrilineatus]
MLSLEERINVLELLSGLDEDDILSLASTVTKGLLKPGSREEANEAVLQHSDSVESILSRKKISRELLFNYLHWKKVTTDSNLDKKSLTSMLLRLWKQPVQSNNEQPNENFANHSNNERNLQVTSHLEPLQVDLFAHKFTEWYYQLLNKDFLQGGNFAVGAEHFWNDATLQIEMMSNGQTVTEEAEGSTASVTLIRDIKQRHKLYFSPNLSAEGVRGRSEPHGAVCVLVCGTLHQSAGVVVGVFEQVFWLIKDPLTNNTWKIKRNQLRLTSKERTVMPTLIEGEITRQLLPIESPD